MDSLDNELVKIRPAQESDCFTIFKLIKDLAIYEKMPDKVIITAEGKLKISKKYRVHTIDIHHHKTTDSPGIYISFSKPATTHDVVLYSRFKTGLLPFIPTVGLCTSS